ncbi:MAG: hypothetical protein HXY25_08580 [Alphaproteobacteria bacterium]|nr:hypothetical protein [Alphaproteobacteria bacterium]
MTFASIRTLSRAVAGALLVTALAGGSALAQSCNAPSGIPAIPDGATASEVELQAARDEVLAYFERSREYRKCLETRLPQCPAGFLIDEDGDAATGKFDRCVETLRQSGGKEAEETYEAVVADYNKDVEVRQDLAAEFQKARNAFNARN